MCKLELERSGIGEIEDAKIQRATGLSDGDIMRTLEELAQGPHWWIRTETQHGMTLYWLRNGLAFEGNVEKGIASSSNCVSFPDSIS